MSKEIPDLDLLHACNIELIPSHYLQTQVQAHPSLKAYVVSQDMRARKLNFDTPAEITILPWRAFLKMLWAGEII